MEDFHALAVENQSKELIGQNSQTEIAISREVQAVQAQVLMAKKFPRDEYMATERIKRACQRKALAESAIYAYPRGGKNVEGPSIRLAEAIAKNWGNLECGVTELEKTEGQSTMMAFAWDLETNTRISKTFTVEHTRDTKAKGKVKLTDDRDIYELTANFGARRLRACILGLIPGDVVEEAVNECKNTLVNDKGESMQSRLEKMLDAFKKEFKVTKDQIEKYVGMQVGAFGNSEIFELIGVYKAIKDGNATIETYFPKEVEAPNPLKKESVNGTDKQ